MMRKGKFGFKEKCECRKTIFVVDVQPEYKDFFQNWMNDIIIFLNKTKFPVVFLYNGDNTLGTISKEDYKKWLLENGLSKEIVQLSIFYDKGYAYFRSLMDEPKLSEKTLVQFVKFLYDNNVSDSRELNKQLLKKYAAKCKNKDGQIIVNLLQSANRTILIPDLMDFLKYYDNILLFGGHKDQCLKEVEIALMALDKKYQLGKFIY